MFYFSLQFTMNLPLDHVTITTIAVFFLVEHLIFMTMWEVLGEAGTM